MLPFEFLLAMPVEIQQENQCIRAVSHDARLSTFRLFDIKTFIIWETD